MLLKMVVEYCNCVEDLPAAAPDILSRLVELLKVTVIPLCRLYTPVMGMVMYTIQYVNWVL